MRKASPEAKTGRRTGMYDRAGLGEPHRVDDVFGKRQ